MIVEAVDLHADLDVSRAGMKEYAQAVIASASRLRQPVSLCGWSMGGLVALQAALDSAPQPHPPGAEPSRGDSGI